MSLKISSTPSIARSLPALVSVLRLLTLSKTLRDPSPLLAVRFQWQSRKAPLLKTTTLEESSTPGWEKDHSTAISRLRGVSSECTAASSPSNQFCPSHSVRVQRCGASGPEHGRYKPEYEDTRGRVTSTRARTLPCVCYEPSLSRTTNPPSRVREGRGERREERGERREERGGKGGGARRERRRLLRKGERGERGQREKRKMPNRVGSNM
eukprot:3208919-Rhodomonas_salina.1